MQHDSFDQDPQEPLSKSARKREQQALQNLGEQLVKLSDKELATIPMDEELAEAVALARRIANKHEALRRQLQFIGKLMRQRDINAIADAINALNAHHQQQTDSFHQLEQWRETLLTGSTEQLTAFLSEFPQANAHRIHELRHQAEQQKANKQPPMASRKLFVYLRELMQNSSSE